MGRKETEEDLSTIVDETRTKEGFYSLEEFEFFLYEKENSKKTQNKASRIDILAGLEPFLPRDYVFG